MSNYIRRSLMVGTSVILMFGITYLESFQIIDHAYFSETRVFVALLMGATMVVVMMLYMLGMYPSKTANISIFLGSALVFAGLLYLLREGRYADRRQDRHADSWQAEARRRPSGKRA